MRTSSARLRRREKRHALRLENLESRLALDGAGVTLVDDVMALRQNGSQESIDVLANDVFEPTYTGEGRITSVSFGSEGGRIEIAPGGDRVLYTPPADFAGTETFDYAVDGAFTATVRVSVQSPLADDRYDVLPTGDTVTLAVWENDPFWDGYQGARRITSVSVGSLGGQIEVAPDGRSILYTAPLDAVKSETFLYVVDDLYSARVTIDIPDPLAPDKYELVQHDPATPLNVLSNDPFWSGYAGERRITHVVGGRSESLVEIAPDGKSLIYTPNVEPGYTWHDTVTYVVDGLYEEQATVIIYRPVVNDSFEVDENSTGFEYNVTANDRFRVLGGSYRDVVDKVTSVTQPENGGVVSISSDGYGVVYAPAPGFTGVDTFTYTADGKHEATVRVNVTRPVRDDAFGSVYQDTPLQTLAVLSNDFLGAGYSGAKIITSVGPTENGGVVQIAAGGKTLLYTPAPGYTGRDVFTYTVDGALTATAQVSVLPLTQNDSASLKHYTLGQSYTHNVLSNDRFRYGYEGPGRVTSVVLVSGAADFTYSMNGELTVTPREAGGATFRYTVDGQYEATFTLSVPVQTARDELVVDQNSGSREVAVLSNDFNRRYHSYIGPRQITGVTQSVNGGAVTIGAGGLISYTPPTDFYGQDAFTYTVDGFWTETVTVNVIRRVRDDLFRVDSVDGAQTLPVLVNDLFGADYSGVGQITDVTAAASGATVTIADDGHTLVYAPAPGFSGTDTFVYTVDGVLKATVEVVVDASAPSQATKFTGVDDYFGFLLDDALERYAYLFGQQAWGSPVAYPTTFALDVDSTSGARGYSETNVQVAGVDEGDLVEFDADYSYILTATGVTIVDAWPAEELSVASTIDIAGTPIAEFLYGDRLTVISEVGSFSPWYGVGDVAVDFSGSRGGLFWPTWTATETVVTVIDVSDREAPQIVQTTTMEGTYVDSRSIDGQVYAVVSNRTQSTLSPQIIDEDNDPQTPNRYETQEEFIARVSANSGQAVEDALPSYTTTGADGEVVRTGLLNTPDTIHRPITDGAHTLITVVSIDAESDAPGLSDTSAIYSTGAATIYGSLGSLYVLDTDYAYSSEDGIVTRIAKFDWDPASGSVEFAATTAVPGQIINQFSVDETDGLLRIATTASNNRSGNWTGRGENLLFVMAEDDGVMEPVGSLQNWALDESIRSVRFLGGRAFATTYENVDPLFAIDLTDPANPKAVGHITLPGFTSYMHLVDENHLLTVGKNTPTGLSGPTQVALFDISNLGQPLRVAEHTFSRFTTSEAEADHHAFGYFGVHGLLAVPVSSTFIERTDGDGDGYAETRQWTRTDRLAVFTVDATAADPGDRLGLSAEIEHAAAVRRSGYIGDKLYSIGDDAVKVVDVADLGTVIASVDLTWSVPTEPPLTDVIYVGDLVDLTPAPVDTEATERAATLATARAHLAEQLGVAAGAPMLLSVESTPAAPGGGETAVFQFGGGYFLYRIGAGGRFEPATDEYRLVDGGAWNAVSSPTVAAPAVPGDFDGDGMVTRDDEAAWREAFGDWSLTEVLTADANLDGIVDAADYTVWKDRFHESSSAASGAVAPESPWDEAFGELRSNPWPASRGLRGDVAPRRVSFRSASETQKQDASLLLIDTPASEGQPAPSEPFVGPTRPDGSDANAAPNRAARDIFFPGERGAFSGDLR